MNTQAPSTGLRPDVTFRLAALVAAIEAAALLGYSLALAVTSLNSSGATESAPVVLIATFVVFCGCVAAVAWGMARGNTTARTPFILVQVFVLIIGYTVFVGDGATVKAIGIAVCVLGLAGLVVGIASVARDKGEA